MRWTFFLLISAFALIWAETVSTRAFPFDNYAFTGTRRCAVSPGGFTASAVAGILDAEVSLTSNRTETLQGKITVNADGTGTRTATVAYSEQFSTSPSFRFGTYTFEEKIISTISKGVLIRKVLDPTTGKFVSGVFTGDTFTTTTPTTIFPTAVPNMPYTLLGLFSTSSITLATSVNSERVTKIFDTNGVQIAPDSYQVCQESDVLVSTTHRD
jgi:hypothetical protein